MYSLWINIYVSDGIHWVYTAKLKICFYKAFVLAVMDKGENLGSPSMYSIYTYLFLIFYSKNICSLIISPRAFDGHASTDSISTGTNCDLKDLIMYIYVFAQALITLQGIRFAKRRHFWVFILNFAFALKNSAFSKHYQTV